MAKISKTELKQIDALVGTPLKTNAMGGAYDAAARMDRGMAGWVPPLQSADSDMLVDKLLIDARARDLGRNDAYVQSGATIHKDSIVGAFFMLSAKPDFKLLGKTQEWAEAFQEEVETKFTLWAESDHKWVDAARINDFTSIIRLAVGVYVYSGEVLATAEWVSQNSREFRTAIQMVDTDRLTTPPDRGFDPMIRGGIKRDAYGAPVSAFIRTKHPSDHLWGPGYDAFWREVPWRKPWGRQMVILLREQMRVDQTRAISDMAAGMREMAIARKFRDVTLQKAVLAASYAATIESELPPEAVYAQLGVGSAGSPDISGAVTDYATNYLAAVNSYLGASKHMQIDGVKIPHLFPGTKLNMQNVADPAGVGQEYEQSLLRYGAAALNLSYEEFSKDFTNANYSTIKAAIAQTRSFMQSRKRIVANGMANAIYRLWLEEAINNDRIDSFRAAEADKLYTNGYQNLMFDGLSNAEWIGASRGQIDELKETQAAVLRIKYGLSTHEDELAALGKDWRKVYVQLERERNERDKRGITLLEDNSVNAASGSPREDQQDGTAAESKSDGKKTK